MQCARCNDDAVSEEGYCRWCHQDYLAALLQFAGPAMIDDKQLWQLWDNRHKGAENAFSDSTVSARQPRR